jgi:hypothetical protein
MVCLSNRIRGSNKIVAFKHFEFRRRVEPFGAGASLKVEHTAAAEGRWQFTGLTSF